MADEKKALEFDDTIKTLNEMMTSEEYRLCKDATQGDILALVDTLAAMSQGIGPLNSFHQGGAFFPTSTANTHMVLLF